MFGTQRNQIGLQKIYCALVPSLVLFTYLSLTEATFGKAQLLALVLSKKYSFSQQLSVVALARVFLGNMGNFGRFRGVCCWRLPWHSPRWGRDAWGFSLIHLLSVGFWRTCIWWGGVGRRSPEALVMEQLAPLKSPRLRNYSAPFGCPPFSSEQRWLLVEIIKQKVFWYFWHN